MSQKNRPHGMMKKLWKPLAFTLAIVSAIALVLFSMPCKVHSLSVNKQTVSMFESCPEALSAMADTPVLMNENQLSISCKGGFPSHNIQLYIRLAYEKGGVLHLSPNATIYNFAPFKNEASFFLRDILDLDETSNYTLIQYELISYHKANAPDYQYAFGTIRDAS